MEHYREVFHAVKDQCAENGVWVNVDTARIRYLELFKNLITDKPLDEYDPIWRVLDAPGLKSKEVETTRYWSNASHEVIAYRKADEMATKGKIVRGVPDRLLRVEYKIKQGRKVQSVLGVRTVAELCEQAEAVTSMYENVLGTTLFRHDPDEILPTGNLERLDEAETLRQAMIECRDADGERWFSSGFLARAGFAALCEHLGYETLRDIYLDVVPGNRPAQQRARKQLATLHRAWVLGKDAPGQSYQHRALYRELRAKVLNESL